MPGVIGLLFHEFAVIVALAIVASAFVSLTLVPMLASRFLTDEAHKKPPGAIVRAFERGFDAHARALHPHRSTSRCAIAASCCSSRCSPSSPPPGCSSPSPRASSPRRTSARSASRTEAAEDTSFPAMVRLQDRVAEMLRADPNVATVNSFNGGRAGGSQNTGRMFINLKPRGERPPMKQVVESLRTKLREVPGISVFMRPIQNLQLGGRQSKAQYQYILQSVQADELNDWAQRLQEPMRADPMFRDVTSDSQLRACRPR